MAAIRRSLLLAFTMSSASLKATKALYPRRYYHRTRNFAAYIARSFSSDKSPDLPVTTTTNTNANRTRSDTWHKPCGLSFHKHSRMKKYFEFYRTGAGMLPRDIRVEENPGPSKFMTPRRIRFNQGERARTWDLIESHDAVCVLVHHAEKDAIILVRQFRPAVYYRDSVSSEDSSSSLSSSTTKTKSTAGFTLEMPAGKSRSQIAAEEVYEETGYRVSADDLKLVNRYRASVGLMGSIHDVFYVQVNEKMREGRGGGVENDGENIEVAYLPTEDIPAFLYDPEKDVPAGLLYSLQWFLLAQARMSQGASIGDMVLRPAKL